VQHLCSRSAAFLAALAAALGCGSSDDAHAPPASPATSGAGAAGAAAASGGGSDAVVGAGGSSAGNGGGGQSDAPYPVPDWPSGDPAEHGIDAAALEAASLVAEEHGSHCLLVIRDGVLVGEWYWQGHDQTTPQKSWSIAKSYSSALAGIAVSRGDLGGLDESLAEHLPAWQGDEREAITLRHVLSMTSGLEWSAWSDYVAMAALASDHSEFALGLGLDAPPGSEWVYHNGAVQLLEPVFRNATGATIEAYAAEHLWGPLGMSATWAHDPSDNPTAYASVMASCRDHARMGYLYLRAGRWVDEQVVAADFVAETLKPSQSMNQAYGLLWWLNGSTPALDAMMGSYPGEMVPFAPDDLFAMRGFGNQFVDVIPSLDLVVVRFGPDPMSSFDLQALADDQKFETHDAILAPVLAAVDAR
jgi:CubicO group peptidase (beta-lactamase class C family)